MSGKPYLGEIKFKPRKITLSMQKARTELKIGDITTEVKSQVEAEME